MRPRVLVVQRRRELDGVEQAVAADGEAALALVAQESFDAVLVDLTMAPLDGWLVLAALGSRTPRPRLIAWVGSRHEVARARALGADLCVLAGTSLHARALQAAWQRLPETSSPRPTPSGVIG